MTRRAYLHWERWSVATIEVLLRCLGLNQGRRKRSSRRMPLLKEALRGMFVSILLERFRTVVKSKRIKLWIPVEGVGDSVSGECKVFCLERRLGWRHLTTAALTPC